MADIAGFAQFREVAAAMDELEQLRQTCAGLRYCCVMVPDAGQPPVVQAFETVEQLQHFLVEQRHYRGCCIPFHGTPWTITSGFPRYLVAPDGHEYSLLPPADRGTAASVARLFQPEALDQLPPPPTPP